MPKDQINKGQGCPSTIDEHNLYEQGFTRLQEWEAEVSSDTEIAAKPINPLEAFFDSHTTGRGIFKWRHYFEIYDRHFRKFVGKDIHILEVGIGAGGSLDMWRHYFGPQCHIYGVDIKERCKAFEDPSQNIFIGDQADRNFWKSFRKEVPALDIIIDDGGHDWLQQVVTLEEMLPHLRSGGVYVCEDIHGTSNKFADYIHGFSRNLHAWEPTKPPTELSSETTPFQSTIRSVHLYPFITVIEKSDQPITEFVAPRRGTQW